MVVHCSTAFDPFPTVLLEAAQAGVPVVASALGGAGEIVEHGETGFVFDPAAPDVGLAYLRQLVADSDLRTRLGAAARQRHERCLRVERMVKGYAGFWKAALDAAPRALAKARSSGSHCSRARATRGRPRPSGRRRSVAVRTEASR